ncbi:MAG: right-handed parallel beta-helix repeat-containing protein [Planctomycetes bacterium]|nr:right-handed parallel beta-helix repeat-containing protein [Planctomycetota bacterium]
MSSSLRAAVGAVFLLAASASAQIVYQVSTVADSGAGSLRSAILAAEADGQPSVIRFAPALHGQTIQLLSSLPSLNAGFTTIDGTDGVSGTPRITLAIGTAPVAYSTGAGGNTLRGLLFTASSGDVLVIRDGGTVIEDCVSTGGSKSMILDRAQATTVRRCSLSGTSQMAVLVLSSTSCTIGPGNLVQGIASTGIVVDIGCSGIEVLGNSVSQTAGPGIYTRSPSTRIDGNTVQDTTAGNVGIRVDATYGCTVSANTVRRTANDGILISSATAGAAHRVGPQNSIEDAGAMGIRISSSSGVSVEDNAGIKRSAQHGIYVGGSSDVSVRRNLAVEANAQDGVHISAGSPRAAVEGNVLRANLRNAVRLESASDAVVARNQLDACPGTALYAVFSPRIVLGPLNTIPSPLGGGLVIDAGCDDARVERNSVTSAGGVGIAILAARAMVDENTVDGCSIFGISVQGGGGSTLQRNQVLRTIGDGISVSGAATAVRTIGPLNRIEDNRGYGVRLSSAGGTRVIGNLSIARHSQSGLLILGSAGCIIEDNLDIAENQRDGVQASSGSHTLSIRRNVLRSNGLAGVNLDFTDGHVVEANRFLQNRNVGLDLRDTNAVQVLRNEFDGTGSAGIMVHAGSDGLRILENSVRGCATGILEAETSGNEIARNRVFENSGIGICAGISDVWIHDNLIYDNGLAGVENRIGNNAVRIVNNTVAFNALGICGVGSIWNNIVHGNGVDLFLDAGADVRYCDIGQDPGGSSASKGTSRPIRSSVRRARPATCGCAWVRLARRRAAPHLREVSRRSTSKARRACSAAASTSGRMSSRRASMPCHHGSRRRMVARSRCASAPAPRTRGGCI